MPVESNKAGKIELKIPSWVASIWNLKNPRWITVEKDVAGPISVGELLAELVIRYPELRKLVFEPDTGKVNDNVMLFLNDTLLRRPDETQVKLSSGDNLLILPVYNGG